MLARAPAIVRTAETVAGAADAQEAAGVIAAAADADVTAAAVEADAIVEVAADRAGEGIKLHHRRLTRMNMHQSKCISRTKKQLN